MWLHGPLPGYSSSYAFANASYLPSASSLSSRSATFFCPEKPETYRPLLENLLKQDPYMLFADFASYTECQNRVDNAYRNQEHWSEMAVINIARARTSSRSALG